MAITSASTSSGSFSNYVNTAASTFIQPGRTITAMAWVRPGTIPAFDHYACYLGSRPSTGSGWGLHLRGQGSSTQPGWGMFFTNDDSNYDDAVMADGSVGTGAVGKWDHVAWVIRSDATEAGFVNGQPYSLTLISNAGAVPAAASRSLYVKFGDGEANETLDGAVAYVRIFDGELGAAEISAEMTAPRAVNRRRPVLVDIPLDPTGISGIVAWDYGPLRLHINANTGTVSWCDGPPVRAAAPPEVLWAERAGTGSGASTSANAEAATGTGTAYNATVTVAPNSSAATGSGTAGAPTATVSPGAGGASGSGTAGTATTTLASNAGNASGTGAAGTAGATVAPNTTTATGTGTAGDAASSVAPVAGVAAGSGSAGAPTPSVAPNAGTATGTGAAGDATITYAEFADAGTASGTGSAGDPTPSVGPSAGGASGTGAAAGPAGSVSPGAGGASGTGSAPTVVPSVTVNAGLASGTGTAYDATVTTSSAGTANAGNAAGTGTAGDPTATVAPNPGGAAGTGTAHAPSATVGPAAGNASGTGTAGQPAAAVAGTSATATGSGSAAAPAPSVAAQPATATGAGAAYDATVVAVSGQAHAGLATGTGVAYDATVLAVATLPALWRILTRLRDCVRDQLAGTDAGLPARVQVSAGELAWDDCACGLLAVTLDQEYPSRVFPVNADSDPAAAGADAGCPPPYLVDIIAVTVLRCAPGPDRNGRPPTTGQLDTATATLADDTDAVRQGVFCCLPGLVDGGLIDRWALGTDSPVGPEGGCVGVTYQVTVGRTAPCMDC